MSASRFISVGGGRASQPDAGAIRPHIFRNKTISKVMSKETDETEERITGKSLRHWVGLIIFRDLSDCNIGLFAAKTASRFAGDWMPSNLSLSARLPTDDVTEHSLSSPW